MAGLRVRPQGGVVEDEEEEGVEEDSMYVFVLSK